MGGGGLQFPVNLRGLPTLFLGLIKNVSIHYCNSRSHTLT
jgi:protein transport protein SEC24